MTDRDIKLFTMSVENGGDVASDANGVVPHVHKHTNDLFRTLFLAGILNLVNDDVLDGGVSDGAEGGGTT